MKPFRGEIHNWRIRRFDKIKYALPESLGYVIYGHPSGHRNLSNWIQTSAVVSHNLETGEVETLNSRYQLVGNEVSNEMSLDL